MIQTGKFHKTALILITWIGVALPGCSATLETRYAAPQGNSINGIVGFVDLMRQSGRKVDVWPAVSPKMRMNYQSIIVFLSTFDEIPDELHRDLESLMTGSGVKTLIIVVRDSDGAIDY